jgi:Spy/CpxP family protein refolding chaperone
MFGHGHGRWGQHWRGAAAPGERAEFAADWVLSRVDASTEQKQQIKTMLQKAFQELQPLREQHMQNRQALVTALTQPAVDRDALDMLRQAELQLAEQASQQVVATLADIAEVLTPEQRASLVDMVSRLHD